MDTRKILVFFVITAFILLSFGVFKSSSSSSEEESSEEEEEENEYIYIANHDGSENNLLSEADALLFIEFYKSVEEFSEYKNNGFVDDYRKYYCLEQEEDVSQYTDIWEPVLNILYDPSLLVDYKGDDIIFEEYKNNLTIQNVEMLFRPPSVYGCSESSEIYKEIVQKILDQHNNFITFIEIFYDKYSGKQIIQSTAPEVFAYFDLHFELLKTKIISNL